VRSQSAEWFSQLAADPRAFMERLDSDTPVAERAVLKYQHLENDFTFVLNLHTGFWNTKVSCSAVCVASHVIDCVGI